MNYNTINPYVRLARNSILLNPYRIETRSIYDYELIYIESGRFQLVYENQTYICEEGELLLLHPGVEHSFTLTDCDLSQPHIHFDLRYEDNSNQVIVSYKSKENMTSEELAMIRTDELADLFPSPILSIPDKKRFLSVFYNLIQEFQTENGYSSLSIRSKMLSLLNMILPVEASPDAHRYSFSLTEIESIKNYIDANCHINLTLKSLQSHFFYSRSFMEKKFKEVYGVSIMHYYKRAKLEKAKELLKSKLVTPTYVSEYLSFSSIYVFSRAFKNLFGISPSAYQKKHRQKKQKSLEEPNEL